MWGDKKVLETFKKNTQDNNMSLPHSIDVSELEGESAKVSQEIQLCDTDTKTLEANRLAC